MWSNKSVYISKITCPYTNLAIEHYLLTLTNTNSLFLYRNSNCVVIGRNQNPFQESSIPFQQSNIPFQQSNSLLLRRKSGGGAVSHDLGNVNYTVFMDKSVFKRSIGTSIVKNALLQLGIPATVSDRNDIHVHNSKVSGSAYKLIKDRAYHHGTMLLFSNLHFLVHSLTSTLDIVKSKAVGSVRAARVGNVCDVTHVGVEQFMSSVVKSYYQWNGMWNVGRVMPEDLSDLSDVVEFIDEKSIVGIDGIQSVIKELKSWEWIYGQTPEFVCNSHWNGIGVQLVVRHCIIVGVDGSVDHPLVGTRFSLSL